MKQHITEKQWNELSSIEQKLWEIFIEKNKHIYKTIIDYDERDITRIVKESHVPNIGLMIEYLADHNILDLFNYKDCVSTKDVSGLCDSLWKQVKSHLQKTQESV